MGSPSSGTGRTVRVVVVLLAIASFVVGGALAGAYLAIRHIVTTTAIGYAKALGIALSPAEVRFGPTFVQLLDCNFTMLEIPGVHGNVRRIDVDLAGLRPSRLLLSGVAVEAKGDPIELRDTALRYWDRVRPKNTRTAEPLPKIEWQHLALNLSTGNDLVPNVLVTELNVETNVGPSRDEMTIRTATTRAGLFDLGALELAVRNQNGVFELGWGPTLHESKWQLTYQSLADADRLRFSFQPESAKRILEWAGAPNIPEAFANAQASGHVEVVRDRTSGKSTGTTKLELTGFVPPFPPELKGYRFADKTTISAQFDVDPLWFAMTLRAIELKTGEISLVGHGRIDRELFSARFRAELATTLDCVTLARGYANSELGGELGRWSAKNAQAAVRGSVAVRVQVDADTSRLADAKVVKRVGIGCGLRPMSPGELLNLGLPPLPDRKTMDRVLQRVTQGNIVNPIGVMPNLLPSLDEVLEAGTRRNPPRSPKPQNQSKQAPK